jgi:hypothetical protein
MRVPPVRIDLLVIHGISLPPSDYGSDAIERFFQFWIIRAPYLKIQGSPGVSHFWCGDGQIVQLFPAVSGPGMRAPRPGADARVAATSPSVSSLRAAISTLHRAPVSALAKLTRCLNALIHAASPNI